MAKTTTYTPEYKREIVKLVTEKGKTRAEVAESIGVSRTTINEWVKKYKEHGVRFTTRAEAKTKIVEYIEMFYNCTRIHSSIGDMSPIEFENMYYASVAA